MGSRDLRKTLAVVFRSPTRLRRLFALGPFGWHATWRFVRTIVPLAGFELEAIRARAAVIPDRALREQALASIESKAYHVEGGAILATFLPPERVRGYVRIVAALETIYDYLDNLCDRLPGVSQQAFATLHEALIDALDDRRQPADYYRDGPAGDDGGYLRSLVDAARDGLRTLPHYADVRDRLVEVARFYAELQVFKHGPPGARERACDAWYARNREQFPGLTWWEFAAACGSSLPIFALIELAARPQLEPGAVAATPGPDVRMNMPQGSQVITTGATVIRGVANLQFPIDKVWSAMVPAYDSLSIPLSVLDASTHTIGNQGLKARRRIGKTGIGEYLNCGNGEGGPSVTSDSSEPVPTSPKRKAGGAKS